ncbi:cell division protein ZapA [uncultured Desulfovibrio sp.]|uniref:cell division protein ZapA n=1 Tax=uncultured Desulfovibrio sp. TaxID=167968 RepID=UPI0026333DA1|nr:cell division protein ZapA [uncultured Desulfovibrio sp.]
MSQEHYNLTVLGTAVSFRHSADLERVREAIALVEGRFADQKLRSHGMQSKDILLTVLALGLADDLLQSQKKLDDVQNRIEAMLSKIEESV